jgi:predicted site-specific integrase-resolvase
MTVEYLKPSAVADEYGLAVGTLANWRVVGQGPDFVTLANGRIRYRREDVATWIEGGTA